MAVKAAGGMRWTDIGGENTTGEPALSSAPKKSARPGGPRVASFMAGYAGPGDSPASTHPTRQSPDDSDD